MHEPLPTTPTLAPAPDAKRPPGPRSLSPLGSAPALARDPLRFALDLWHQYGDVAHFRFLFWPAYAFYHPDQVKQVLQDHHRTYDKQLPNIGAVRPIFGNGLFTNSGESWLHQRRLMQPSFHHQRLAGFATIMTEATLDMLERWQRAGAAPLDIPLEMTRLTLRIVGLALFNLDLSQEAETIGRTLTRVLPLLSEYLFVPFPPLWVPTSRNRRFQAGLETLNQAVYSLIKERRQRATDPDRDRGDLLSMLLAARDAETGEGMTDQQVRDEVLTLLIAGYETTAMALTWTWYLLSEHPEVEQRLHAELETVLGGQTPTVAALNQLPYTRRVIQEAMRLYPPISSLTRRAIESSELGGYRLPANSIIVLSAYCTHRHPAFWEEPERFDPERFTPERSAARPRFAYFPFGGGPRQCLGNAFAMLEAQLVLATVAQRFALRLVPGHPVEPQVRLTLRPRYGLPMTLHPLHALPESRSPLASKV